jgi:hypothetical protein
MPALEHAGVTPRRPNLSGSRQIVTKAGGVAVYGARWSRMAFRLSLIRNITIMI